MKKLLALTIITAAIYTTGYASGNESPDISPTKSMYNQKKADGEIKFAAKRLFKQNRNDYARKKIRTVEKIIINDRKNN